MSLLIQEPPLQVLPSLAVKVGLNEAIVLQQIHYWLLKSNNVRDGHRWVYNSYSEWNKQFPFWSRNTLIRTFNRLEKQGYLISANYNKAKFDKTKWYRIDYQRLDGKSFTQNGHARNPELEDGGTKNGQTNTKRLPETTSETNNKHSASPSNAPSVHQLEDDFETVWKQYPNKKGKKDAFNHYKAWRKKSKSNTNDHLLKRLSIYKDYIEANKSWYHPMNGSTWFNGRFDDDWSTDGATTQSSFDEDKFFNDNSNPIPDVNADELPF